MVTPQWCRKIRCGGCKARPGERSREEEEDRTRGEEEDTRKRSQAEPRESQSLTGACSPSAGDFGAQEAGDSNVASRSENTRLPKKVAFESANRREFLFCVARQPLEACCSSSLRLVLRTELLADPVFPVSSMSMHAILALILKLSKHLDIIDLLLCGFFFEKPTVRPLTVVALRLSCLQLAIVLRRALLELRRRLLLLLLVVARTTKNQFKGDHFLVVTVE